MVSCTSTAPILEYLGRPASAGRAVGNSGLEGSGKWTGWGQRMSQGKEKERGDNEGKQTFLRTGAGSKTKASRARPASRSHRQPGQS